MFGVVREIVRLRQNGPAGIRSFSPYLLLERPLEMSPSFFLSRLDLLIRIAIILSICLIATQFRLIAQEVIEPREAPARPPAGWGPIQFPTPLSPFQKLRMVFFHQGPNLQAPGTYEFTSTVTWANLWILRREKLIVDVEAWSLNEFLEYTISERVAVSFMLPMIFIHGGFMDGFIEKFHDTFGLGNMNREEFPRNNVRMEILKKDGTRVRIVDSTGSTLWVRAPVLSLRFRLNSPESNVPFTLKFSVDFPEVERESNIVESEGRDWAVGISTALDFSQSVTVTASLAYLDLRKGKLQEDFKLKEEGISSMLSLAYQFGARSAFIAQIARETPVAEDTDTGFDATTTNLVFGFKWLLDSGTVIEAGLVENLFVSDNNADFALHGGVSFFF